MMIFLYVLQFFSSDTLVIWAQHNDVRILNIREQLWLVEIMHIFFNSILFVSVDFFRNRTLFICLCVFVAFFNGSTKRTMHTYIHTLHWHDSSHTLTLVCSICFVSFVRWCFDSIHAFIWLYFMLDILFSSFRFDFVSFYPISSKDVPVYREV